MQRRRVASGSVRTAGPRTPAGAIGRTGTAYLERVDLHHRPRVRRLEHSLPALQPATGGSPSRCFGRRGPAWSLFCPRTNPWSSADRVDFQPLVPALVVDGGRVIYQLHCVQRTPLGCIVYRKPAYLICTNPNLSLDQVLQAYLWRWDIEVNFRDEKTLRGVGQAQMRHPHSVESVPALAVAAYALLLLAATQTYGPNGMPDTHPRHHPRPDPSASMGSVGPWVAFNPLSPASRPCASQTTSRRIYPTLSIPPSSLRSPHEKRPKTRPRHSVA